MNPQAFEILEFGYLRELVRHHAQTVMGAARIDQLAPISECELLQRDLGATREMITLRGRGTRLALEGIADPAESLSRLKIEGTALDPLAILALARLCEAAMAARSALASDRETCLRLFELVAALPKDLTALAALLRKKILPSGELDDRASPELAAIRRDINNARSRITRTLEGVMRRSSEAVQEELVTIRNERFVIPVRSDHQGRIKGVTHGSSSSGATIFVEPLETIEANNELQTLREAEQREIAEILFGLSEEIRRVLPGIEHAAAVITDLDFINAKSAFGEKFDCVVPTVTEPRAIASGSETQVEMRDGQTIARGSDPQSLEFVDARHPLLEETLRRNGGQVVPISFKLGAEHSTMVISGANAGGKTVVLKTAGLLALMGLSGLPIPAAEARIPFYRSILADIGDHQSLAANLSTFTSHVANIASMIDLCETPALVLLDEVGTGTDPEEGSALGVAVVDHFKQRAAHVLATTHYSGLKMYAANEPGVLNASVEFDEQTLQPTYKLLVGLAGSSSGLDIAERFGIPREMIAKAGEQVNRSSREAIEYLRRIKREAETAEALRGALEEERAAVAEKFATLERQFQQHERERQAHFDKELSNAISDFENRSRELLGKIQDRAERAKVEREAQKRAAELKREAQLAAKAATASHLVEQPKEPSQAGLSHLRGVRVVRDGQVVVEGNKTQTRRLAKSTRAGAPPEKQGTAVMSVDRTIRVGDTVRLRTLGTVGIVDQIKDDDVQVRVGSLHTREKISNVEVVNEQISSSARRQGSREDLRRQAATTEVHLHSREADSKLPTNTELNLIGKKTDEAVEITDKFLDEAFLNGQREVRIIHGHGTGALRRAIAELLSDHPHVSKFTAAAHDQGGRGATIVELRA